MFDSLKKKLIEAVDDYCGLVNGKGEIVICSDSDKEGTVYPGFKGIELKKGNIVRSDGYIHSLVSPDYHNKYFLFMKETSGESEKILRLLSMFAENYLRQQLEKNNIFYFYKKLLNNELSENEIHENASLYKIRNETERAVIVFRHGESEYPVS
ncbi:MAG: hypothetical protein R3232_02015, partial [Clostridia bacterium]|nr:hypothetical protein [Clostridia bacterium]